VRLLLLMILLLLELLALTVTGQAEHQQLRQQ
jgi:hypothetical protein